MFHRRGAKGAKNMMNRIKNGTVVKFKMTGDHFDRFGIVVPYGNYGGSKLKCFDPDKGIVDFMGLSESFLLKCEIVGSKNLKKLKYYITLHDAVGKIESSYDDYLKSAIPATSAPLR